MGSSAKTLARLQDLIATGAVPDGGAVCDIGETQIFGDDAGSAARAFLDFCAGRSPRAVKSSNLSHQQAALIGPGKLLGDLLELAGFSYVALDIFPGRRTHLFDLNVHEPGPGLAGQFDLVLNLGTTEHVFNQLRAFQSIHALAKIGGVYYHDLPIGGYPHHALFRYDPLVFALMAEANDYGVLAERISCGPGDPVPERMRAIGFSLPSVNNVGFEFVARRPSAAPFNIPMEMGTSLAIDSGLSSRVDDRVVMTPAVMRVDYGTALYGVSFQLLTALWLRRLLSGIRRRLGFGI